ncbi:MAG: hypothetical protein KAU52_03685 [Methanosarcinales archaeon]|nr:hypothetical protein [Methanosarcinales archaeon]
MDKNKTLGFQDILELFSKISELPPLEKTKIEKFHKKLRNEIQHRALNLPMNKGEKIEDFKLVISSVYRRAFASRNYPL